VRMGLGDRGLCCTLGGGRTGAVERPISPNSDRCVGASPGFSILVNILLSETRLFVPPKELCGVKPGVWVGSDEGLRSFAISSPLPSSLAS
jgi:hypothetical protein